MKCTNKSYYSVLFAYHLVSCSQSAPLFSWLRPPVWAPCQGKRMEERWGAFLCSSRYRSSSSLVLLVAAGRETEWEKESFRVVFGSQTAERLHATSVISTKNKHNLLHVEEHTHTHTRGKTSKSTWGEWGKLGYFLLPLGKKRRRN